MKNRVLGLDIVRFVAILFVCCVHFFLHNGFYGIRMTINISFVLLFVRWLFYPCVPLFMILTGYLKCKKKLEKSYYNDLIKILISYVFIEIIIFIFNRYYMHDTISITRGITKIIGMNVNDYSWYVRMYFGLFLLIPFLNLIYNNLKEKKEKQILIITLILLTGLPSIFSRMNFDINMFPNWWVGIYPFTYYFLGCYLREYKIKCNKIILILCLGLMLFFQTTFTFFNSYNKVLYCDFMGEYGSITVVILSVLLFLIFYDLNTNNKHIRKFITSVSKCSFDIYLFSYIIDNIIYYKFNIGTTFQSVKYFYFPLITFFTAYILSLIKLLIFKIINVIIKHSSKEKLTNT